MTPEPVRRGALALLVLSPLAIFPALLFLVSCGDRAEVREIAPAATVVSASTPAPTTTCIMFCDEPPFWSMTMASPSSTENLCPPFCEHEKW